MLEKLTAGLVLGIWGIGLAVLWFALERLWHIGLKAVQRRGHLVHWHREPDPVINDLEPVWVCVTAVVVFAFVAVTYVTPALQAFRLGEYSPPINMNELPFSLFRYFATLALEVYFMVRIAPDVGFKLRWAAAWMVFSLGLTAVS